VITIQAYVTRFNSQNLLISPPAERIDASFKILHISKERSSTLHLFLQSDGYGDFTYYAITLSQHSFNVNRHLQFLLLLLLLLLLLSSSSSSFLSLLSSLLFLLLLLFFFFFFFF